MVRIDAEQNIFSPWIFNGKREKNGDRTYRKRRHGTLSVFVTALR